MKGLAAYAKLRALGVPAVSTADAAAVLNQSANTANKTLQRLAASGLVTPIRRGLWALSPNVDPLLLPEYLTAPLPSYVSLQTALYRHGLVEPIPAVVYAVSLNRSRRITTPVATFSIHRVAREVFGGFDVGDDGVKLATPEKALFDVFYLSATRDRRFAALPELELPRPLDRRALRDWTAKITSPTLAKIVAAKLARLESSRRGTFGAPRASR